MIFITQCDSAAFWQINLLHLSKATIPTVFTLIQTGIFIEYCKALGIHIPHYCYYKHLSHFGNCRMCFIINFKPC